MELSAGDEGRGYAAQAPSAEAWQGGGATAAARARDSAVETSLSDGVSS